MNTLSNGLLQGPVTLTPRRINRTIPPPDKAGQNGHVAHDRPLDVDFLRRCAWEIGERRPADGYTPPANHAGLAMVTPNQGFAYWRILQEWVDQAALERGPAWQDCRLLLRLYDVSLIEFTGLNAHRIQDHTLPSLCGQFFFKLPRPGTSQLAEVGFLLRSGEFIPAARSQTVSFPGDTSCPRGGQTALLVKGPGQVEEIGNVWEQERIMWERSQPRLRQSLRIAAFAFASLSTGQDGPLARFVTELASGQSARGHEVHVFVPGSASFNAPHQEVGVNYHPLALTQDGTPLEIARAYGHAAEERLRGEQPFDLIHLHEWMTGLVPRAGAAPALLSLGSLETTRRNGTPPTDLSLEIEQTERDLAQMVDGILTPDWLREKAVTELGLNGSRVFAFPMEGRLPNEWECPLDHGKVKMEIGVGPLDRLLLFIGPLEYAAGADLILEALPVLLQRAHNLRLAFVGAGPQYGHLQHRAYQLGVAHAVRLPGHREGSPVIRLMRSAEALVLPSRYRVPFDDAVVDLARRAGRPVVTTHGGPAHLVRHEENGLVTYDNPGSMVWALDRIVGDPFHAERMGRNGRRGSDGGSVVWSEVARHYLDLCAAHFPELAEVQW
jgi:glycogen(starch) synthase